MNVVAKRYDEYAKMARQAAYGLPPEEAVKKIMGLASSGIPEFVLMSEAKKILESSKPPAQAPQSTVKDKILAAAAPQQAMPQGMPQGMPQPGVPPQEMPQQAMPPMPEGLPPMPPQGMAEGGSVNDYGVASLPGERRDEYAIDQGLGSLSADIDYAGGGIVSFAEGGESRARKILEEGLPDPYQDEELSPDAMGLYRDSGELRTSRLRSARKTPFEQKLKSIAEHNSDIDRAFREPELTRSDMYYATYPYSGRAGKIAKPVMPVMEEEPNPDEAYMAEINGLFGQGPAGIGRISIPKVTEEEFPDAPQIERTPEFDLEKRLAQEAEANTAYGVNPNLLAEQSAALNEDLAALQGRAKQATWASLGKRAADAWDVQPGQGAPTLLGGLANLFGGMTEDLEASNAAVRAEKREIQRYQRELARADNLERKGQAAKAQEVRVQNEITRRGEENKQRELNAARESGLFALNQSRVDKELDLNTQIDIANMKERGAFDRAALSARSGAMGNIYKLQEMMLDLEKHGLVKPGEGGKLLEQVYSDPQLRTAAEEALKAQGKLEDATEADIAEAMDTIANQRVARMMDLLMSNQKTQIGGIRERIFGNSGYGAETVSGGL